MQPPEPTITVNVDVTNPGEFFACCGLLELADRLWPGAEGWFTSTEFCIHNAAGSSMDDAGELFSNIRDCRISSSMTEEQTSRLKSLKNLNKKKRTAETDLETHTLNVLWESERLHFGRPFDLWLDWWSDMASGGKSLKTWAGKQFISDLVASIHAAIRRDEWEAVPMQGRLIHSVNHGGLPLYFDADIGAHSSTIDVGFSLDRLDMRGTIRPMVELLAFAGLQRFRPMPATERGRYRYRIWTHPLDVLTASVVCSGGVEFVGTQSYEFRLHYRTEYLKSFLSAVPVRGENE
ncbi:MAG: type I-U CRISPR-associated protein Cas8c [Planctomycetaceae bacterium]